MERRKDNIYRIIKFLYWDWDYISCDDEPVIVNLSYDDADEHIIIACVCQVLTTRLHPIFSHSSPCQFDIF